MDNSRIVEKMKKLLALSESTSNENEALSAARKLHAMLAKHNISISELGDDSDGISSDGILEYNRPWKRVLAVEISRLYFCECYIAKADKTSKIMYMFVGTDSNRTFAMHIFNMIVKTVEKESRFESKLLYGKIDSSFETSFRVGAMQRISERCGELISRGKDGTLEDDKGGKLPVLLSVYESNTLACKDWMESNLNLKSLANKTRATDPVGLAKGAEAGNRVQLTRAIQKTQSPKLLKLEK